MTDAHRPPPPASTAAAGDDFVFVEARWELRQRYFREPLQRKAADALTEGRLLGVRNPINGRVLFPAASFWDDPYALLDELVEVGPGGVIRTLTVLPNSKTSPAITVVHVQLDGASTACPGLLRGIEGEPANPLGLIGQRCRAVFGEEPADRTGTYWYELGG